MNDEAELILELWNYVNAFTKEDREFFENLESNQQLEFILESLDYEIKDGMIVESEKSDEKDKEILDENFIDLGILGKVNKKVLLIGGGILLFLIIIIIIFMIK